jgi:SAM-dependent methyltransferase
VNRDQWATLARVFEDEVSDITSSETNGGLGEAVTRATLGLRRATLVDLGCGIGTFVAKFGGGFHRVIAVDFSSDMLCRAQSICRHLRRVTWLCADIPKAALEIPATADLTACLNVITSPSAARRSAIWDSVAAVTRPGGTAIVVVPALESAEFVARQTGQRLRRRRARPNDTGLLVRAGCVQKFFLESEVAELMESVGFEAVCLQKIEYPWAEEGVSIRRMRGKQLPWDWLATGVLEGVSGSGPGKAIALSEE